MPHGYKTCGGCGASVKGPRTLVCPECNFSFVVGAGARSKPPVVTRPKMRVSKPVEEFETYRGIAMCDTSGFADIPHTISKCVSGRSVPKASGIEKVMKYLINIPTPENVTIPATVEVA